MFSGGFSCRDGLARFGCELWKRVRPLRFFSERRKVVPLRALDLGSRSCFGNGMGRNGAPPAETSNLMIFTPDEVISIRFRSHHVLYKLWLSAFLISQTTGVFAVSRRNAMDVMLSLDD